MRDKDKLVEFLQYLINKENGIDVVRWKKTSRLGYLTEILEIIENHESRVQLAEITREEIEHWIVMLFGDLEYHEEYFNQCVDMVEGWFKSKGIEAIEL